MPTRINAWEELSDKTKKNYISVWGSEEAAQERYESGQPMRREASPGQALDVAAAAALAQRLANITPAALAHAQAVTDQAQTVDPATVASVTVQSNGPGQPILVQVVYQPIPYHDGEEVFRVVRQDNNVFEHVEMAPEWLQPTVRKLLEAIATHQQVQQGEP
jgi:hypothetical protein